MPAPTERILGIDPGSHRMGVGCIDKSGNQLKLVFAEVLSAPAKDDFYTRLALIRERFDEVLRQLRPTTIAVEDAFHHKNARSALLLGVARGIVLGSCLRQGLKIFEYAPTQVKSLVTGYGRADKDQVQKMVGLTLGAHLKIGVDASDALAVAICHASQSPLLRLDLGKSAKAKTGKRCSDSFAEK